MPHPGAPAATQGVLFAMSIAARFLLWSSTRTRVTVALRLPLPEPELYGRPHRLPPQGPFAAVRLPAVLQANVDHYIALVKWLPQASDVDMRPSTERDVENDSDSSTIDEVLCVGRRFPAYARWAGGMLVNGDDGGRGKLFGRVGGGFHARQSFAHSSFLDVASAGS